MKERIQFLIRVRDAEELGFPLHLGRPAGLWILVTATPGDKVFELVRRCQVQWHAQGKFGDFANGWRCRRVYTSAELEAAELFRLVPDGLDSEAASDPSVYDLSRACSRCGAGRRQVADLLIDQVRLPKSRQIVHTIGKEWLFRMELAEALQRERFTGFRFRPVRHCRNRSDMPIDLKRYPTGRQILEQAALKGGLPVTGIELEYPELWPRLMSEHQEAIRLAEARVPRRVSSVWTQLDITSVPAQTGPPTEFGITYFDRDEEGRYRCPFGHTSGSSLISEVWIQRKDWDGSDLIATADLYGFRSGYFVPEPALLMSPRLYGFLARQKPKGVRFEVAHLIEE